MRNLQKPTMILLMICLVMTMLISPASNVQAAKKKIKISKKSVTLVVGKKVTIKVKNAPKGKKVTWSSNKKKVATVNKKGVVTAKKAGKANITAKVAGKKYICKITVKKKSAKNSTATPKTTVLKATSKPATPTPTIKVEKNADDVTALKKIINEQKESGAKVSTNLDDSSYGWDEKGRLSRINWWYCDLSGVLHFEELPALTSLTCGGSELDRIDVSGNDALTELDCQGCKLTYLDISNNAELQVLKCNNNQLSSLNVSHNPKLDTL
ncbi:MAG: Ig-like domain-containing protein [Clostridium sp.]